MKHFRRAITRRTVRFLLAGAINTAVNFLVLNYMFYGLHLSKLTSIIIATSCAIAVSFVLNRSFVFVDRAQPVKKLSRFVIVSIIGVFVIQSSVFALMLLVLVGHEMGIVHTIQTAVYYKLSSDFVEINLSNIVASLVVTFCNYNAYRLFVFKGTRRESVTIESTDAEAS